LSTFTTYFKKKRRRKRKKEEKHCSEFFPTVIRYTKQKNKERKERRKENDREEGQRKTIGNIKILCFLPFLFYCLN